jgi:3-oxoacyl-(acyl-carrier-protein) synthase
VAERSPVITGVGIVSAAGIGVEEVWASMARNESGLKPLSLFESPRYGPVPVGEIRQNLLALGAPRRGSRTDRLGWLAAREAVQLADIDFRKCAERAGVVLGSSVGGSFDSERFLTALIKRGRMRADPTRYHECSCTVDLVADHFGLLGPSMAVSTACSSGALAIATAAEMILAGDADVMLAGGSDSLSRMTWGGFHSLLLVDANGCRPFDASRAGMSLGEGAGVLVIESEEHARKRGARILARLSGWGASCDAYHATAPHPEGAGALASMQSALRRASLEPSTIDYVNAHGTGTRDNDLAEGKALKALFGERVPPVSSTKRFFGHALAASGAMEAVACVEALRRQQLLPNPGFTSVDPAIGVEPITSMRPAKLMHVMSNSFGFGGNNAALIFSAPEVDVAPRIAKFSPVAVTGIGVIGPGAVREREIDPPLPPGSVRVHHCGTLDTSTLNPNQRRRLSRIVQMAVLAARASHKPDPSKRIAVAIGTGMGCLEAGGVFIENMIAKDEREPMPSFFPGSVHNGPAAQVAIDLGARSFNSAPTASEISFEAALWQGMSQLATGETDAALVGSVDELNKYVLAMGKRWKVWTEQTRPGEGAVVAKLARQAEAGEPLARVTAVRLGRYQRPFDAKREAEWIASAVDLNNVDVLLSGAKGLPILESNYFAVAEALSARTSRSIEHQTYKQHCGEFHSASAFGFSVAVDLVRSGKHGVLLYTLAARGAKALCFVQP